jgi:hypothetical protein
MVTNLLRLPFAIFDTWKAHRLGHFLLLQLGEFGMHPFALASHPMLLKYVFS